MSKLTLTRAAFLEMDARDEDAINTWFGVQEAMPLKDALHNGMSLYSLFRLCDRHNILRPLTRLACAYRIIIGALDEDYLATLPHGSEGLGEGFFAVSAYSGIIGVCLHTDKTSHFTGLDQVCRELALSHLSDMIA